MKGKLKTNTKIIIIISSLISICLVLFIAFNANHYISRMSKNNTELYNAYRISELMKSFKSNIALLESKQRGYIITGDGKFLEAYKVKESETKTYLKSMEKYFSGKHEEEAFYKLKELTYKKLMEAKDLSGGQNTANLPGEHDNQDGGGIKTMAEINNTVDAINDSLSKTTKVLLDNSIEYVNVSKNWSYLEIALGILSAITAVIILLSDINTRNKLENELRLAKKQADDNAIMKEQFMANMSHEIRTPMNAILGFSDLLQKTNLDKTQTDYLLAVKTSSSNLLNIINDILDFSKIEAGKLTIEKISFNIINLLNSLKVIFDQKATEKQINFSLTIDKKTPSFVFGDPTRLTQILINLVNNAIKFTNQGSVSVTCIIKNVEHDVVQFVFKIKDTGIGIPSDKIDSIFERFNQGNTETTRNYGGTGLGLAIVKQLLEIQGGEITINSKEGLGSEFTISIQYPISYEKAGIPLESNNTSLKINSKIPLHVLLVEDNFLNQKLASIYLIGFGLIVDIAENGLEAIQKLKTKKYHLILMDIQMPTLDGYSAAEIIRGELNLSLPIIAVTANIMPNEREKCMSYGMTDYISKPFKELDLFNIVNFYIGDNTKTLASAKNNEVVAEKKISNKEGSTIVDMEQLHSISRGNKVLLDEIITIFLKQYPIEIKDIEQAINLKEYSSIKTISHKMNSSVGFMGMNIVLEELRKLEILAENNEEIKDISVLFTSIKKNCELAELELKAVLLDT